jgi:pimeloyl-ACP methyl ester carboxylesterase
VVFLHGFMSDMTGSKALALEEWCRRRGQAFVRLDTQGHGQSSGSFEDGTIGAWAADVVSVLDAVTEGPLVLVGSSMGGWLMLLAALQRRERVVGLVGIAAAPDFTQDLIWGELTEEQRRTLLTEGRIIVPSDYGAAGYPITRRLIDEGRHNLLLHDVVNLHCPVRLIHGMRDRDVPWRTALRLQEQLASEDVEVVLVKDGDHRLSRDEDLARLRNVVDGLLRHLEGPAA